MNIPVYRAKMIDSDGYVIGFFHSRKWDGETRTEYYITYESLEWEIDPTTLAIHFLDILDSQGNKIFASLSEDGKGGDIVEYDGGQEIIKYSNGTIQTYMFRFEDLKELNFKAVGIQE